MLPFTRLVKKGVNFFGFFALSEVSLKKKTNFQVFFRQKMNKGVSSAKETKGLSLFSSLLLSNGAGGAVVVGVGVGRRRRAQLHHSVAEL